MLGLLQVVVGRVELTHLLVGDASRVNVMLSIPMLYCMVMQKMG